MAFRLKPALSPFDNPVMMGLWPFTARATELERVARALKDRSSRGLVLSGAAGVGKSRLAAEAVRDLDPRRVEAGGSRVLVRRNRRSQAQSALA